MNVSFCQTKKLFRRLISMISTTTLWLKRVFSLHKLERFRLHKKNYENKIAQRDWMIDFITCSRRVCNGVNLIKFKYMSWHFVQHFQKLKEEILWEGYRVLKDSREWKRWDELSFNDKVASALEKLSHLRRFRVFLKWLVFSNEYHHASCKKIGQKYRNGRLPIFAAEVRALVQNHGDEVSIDKLADKFKLVWDVGCDVAKDSDVDQSDVERLNRFVGATLKLFSNDKLAGFCKRVMEKVFSGSHEVTDLEKSTLQENGWFA